MSSDVYKITDRDRSRFPDSTADQTTGEKGGIVQQRRTTDVLFFLGILGLWAVMTVVGAVASSKGDLNRLLHPLDDQGRVCGVSTGVSGLPNFYTVSPVTGLGVCVPSCPSRQASFASLSPSDYVCSSWVTNLNLNPSTTFPAYIRTSCQTNGVFDPRTTRTTCGCNLVQNTTSVFGRCAFNDPNVRALYPSQSFSNYFQLFMGDVIAARNIIFGFGLLASLGAAFVYMHLLRFKTVGLVTVWTCIVTLVGVCGLFVWLGITTVMTWAAETPPAHSSEERYALYVLFVAVGVGAFLFLCVCVSLRAQISTAVGVLSLAATAFESMPLMVLSPLIQTAGLALFCVPLFFYGFSVATSGTFKNQYASCTSTVPGLCTAANAALSRTTNNATSVYVGQQYQLDSAASAEQLWYLFFCLLWTMNFIAGLGTLVVAVAVARWYFTTPDERANVTSLTFFQSYGIVLRYHMGTAAFGGLLISLVQFARWVALYMEKHFKQTGTGPARILLRVVCCCVDCCLACLECCMRFVSKQAYIQTAIHGAGFCTSAKEAFFAIARNILSVGAVSIVTGLGLVVGKIWIMAVVGLASFFWFTATLQQDMHSLVAPTVLIMILAYIVASVVMDVLHTTVDTVILCYIHDSEANQGRAVYAHQSMAAFLQEHGPIKEQPEGATSARDQQPIRMMSPVV